MSWISILIMSGLLSVSPQDKHDRQGRAALEGYLIKAGEFHIFERREDIGKAPGFCMSGIFITDAVERKANFLLGAKIKVTGNIVRWPSLQSGVLQLKIQGKAVVNSCFGEYFFIGRRIDRD